MSVTFDLEDQGHILFSMVVYVAKIQLNTVNSLRDIMIQLL